MDRYVTLPLNAVNALYAFWDTYWNRVAHTDPGDDFPGHSVITNADLMLLETASDAVEPHQRVILREIARAESGGVIDIGYLSLPAEIQREVES